MKTTTKKTTPKKRKIRAKSTKKLIEKKNPKNAGRKCFDGKDVKSVLAKLESAAAIDASVPEMCFYAGISETSYYRYNKENLVFRERIESLRNKPILAARQRINKGIEESFSNAMSYLERKRKAEFSTRSELAVDGEIINKHTVSPETEELIRKAMGGFAKKVSSLANKEKDNETATRTA